MGEYRFVPVGWKSPLPYHIVEVIHDLDVIKKWRQKLKNARPVTWYVGKEPYTVLVSYRAELRPVLVRVSGIR